MSENIIFKINDVLSQRWFSFPHNPDLLSHLYAESKNKSYQYFMLSRYKLGEQRASLARTRRLKVGLKARAFDQKIFWHASL